MLRRRVLLALLALPCLLVPGRRPWAAAPKPKDGSSEPTLQETLESGLKARRPEEFQFVRRVVAAVEQKRLPEPVVLSTFTWARKQRKYPFQYFEQAIKLRASKFGVRL